MLPPGEAVLWVDDTDRVRGAVWRPDFVAARPLDNLGSLLGRRVQEHGPPALLASIDCVLWTARRTGELVGPVPYDAQLPSGLWIIRVSLGLALHHAPAAHDPGEDRARAPARRRLVVRVLRALAAEEPDGR